MKKLHFLLITCMLLTYYGFSQPQPNGKVYNVALFVPSGAELLDFAGPGEVFTQAYGFEVYLVSLTEEPIISQGFMTITPNYSFRNCPKPDIILIPGGGTGNLLNEPDAVSWVKKHYEQGGTVLTVCTGASIAAKAGLLEGKKATTFHNAFDYVENLCENCELLRNVRYVDNGRIITTAGISAGIDGALHMVARVKGKDIAEAAAFNMEYDKWVPGEGLMNYENEFVQYLREHGVEATRKQYKEQLDKEAQSLFFVGEMKNQAAALSEAGQHEKAASVLKFCAEYYPNEAIIYNQLREVYAALGQPVPPTFDDFAALIKKEDTDGLYKLYEEASAAFPGWVLFQESHMNWAGYQLMGQGKIEQAIAAFELNKRAYPTSFNVYDSLAEAYLKNEQWDKARQFYERSLKLNPGNENAQKMLKKIDNR